LLGIIGQSTFRQKNLPFAGVGGCALAIDGDATAGREGCDDAAGKQEFVLKSHNYVSGFLFVPVKGRFGQVFADTVKCPGRKSDFESLPIPRGFKEKALFQDLDSRTTCAYCVGGGGILSPSLRYCQMASICFAPLPS
jgi:hypothetical protein